MNASVGSRKVQEIVESVLTAQFPKIRIAAINVRDATDDDGAHLLEIAVVFEAKGGDFEPAKVPTCISEIADRLDEVDDSRFPVLSFITKSDWGKTKSEAA